MTPVEKTLTIAQFGLGASIPDYFSQLNINFSPTKQPTLFSKAFHPVH